MKQTRTPFKPILAWLVAFLLLANTADAQLQKILHQSFDIEEVTSISLDLYGEYELEKWAGNTILTETHIQLYDASPNIMDFYVKQGRYDMEGTLDGEHFKMISKDKVRKTLKTKEGECFEFIKLRIFIPEDFTIVDQKRLVKQSDQQQAPVTSKESDQ